MEQFTITTSMIKWEMSLWDWLKRDIHADIYLSIILSICTARFFVKLDKTNTRDTIQRDGFSDYALIDKLNKKMNAVLIVLMLLINPKQLPKPR